MKIRVIARLVILALTAVCVAKARGQASASQAAGAQPAASSKLTCPIDRTPPSEADKALRQRRFPDAERLYGEAVAANPNSDVALAGQVRTILAEDKLADALALAIKDNGAHPNDPVLLDALGEVRFRRGEVDEAATAFNQSAKLNSCNGVTHYDVSRFLSLSGMHKSAQRRLDIAHALAPLNPEIAERWEQTHAVPMTQEQLLASLKTQQKDASLSAEAKQGVEAAIKGIESNERGDCKLVSPVAEAKLPIVPIANGLTMQQDMRAAALDIQFNGKRRRLEIDTGASGLLLSRDVAKSAGLVPEAEIKESGVGDEGSAGAFVTHVDDIKIGAMEFKNCMVQVLEKDSKLGSDGLIGPDVFRDFLVTLDIPGREVRLGPLPKRPDETAAQPASLDTSGKSEGLLSEADSAKDRYVAPEMKDWTPVFRYGHFLIFPTVIGKTPVKLFMMDTGAGMDTITPEAAREVTHVAGSGDVHIFGISGEVKKTLVADKVTIGFAGVRQMVSDMDSFDSGSITQFSGVEISGAIGFPTLRELVITIDYRDNLIHVVYDPNKGYHAH
jgi:predicted aspartyl protease/Flp pilus assembly protein TadD